MQVPQYTYRAGPQSGYGVLSASPFPEGGSGDSAAAPAASTTGAAAAAAAAADPQKRGPRPRAPPQYLSHGNNREVSEVGGIPIAVDLSGSTRFSYARISRRFIHWCKLHGRVSYPATEATLAEWLGSLNTVSRESHAVYISAVNAYQMGMYERELEEKRKIDPNAELAPLIPLQPLSYTATASIMTAMKGEEPKGARSRNKETSLLGTGPKSALPPSMQAIHAQTQMNHLTYISGGYPPQNMQYAVQPQVQQQFYVPPNSSYSIDPQSLLQPQQRLPYQLPPQLAQYYASASGGGSYVDARGYGMSVPQQQQVQQAQQQVQQVQQQQVQQQQQMYMQQQQQRQQLQQQQYAQMQYQQPMYGSYPQQSYAYTQMAYSTQPQQQQQQQSYMKQEGKRDGAGADGGEDAAVGKKRRLDDDNAGSAVNHDQNAE